MDTPRIIAVDDVRLNAPVACLSEAASFYSEHLGLHRIAEASETLTFCGYPRSGPRLIVTGTPEPLEKPPRRQALIQVASLYQSAESLMQEGFEVTWTRGLFHYDRRLWVTDPGGNIIELVTQHLF